MTTRAGVVAGTVVALAVGAVLATRDRRGEAERADSAAFQRVVGGMGFGPAVDLESPAALDPRVARDPRLEPVPAAPAAFPLPPPSLLPAP
jgi:hypothetical protein